ncbi:hypothetical protein BHE74_00019439 [Ensete ventricosum]|nr:hypothetical protein BHE74_00019439 [Ensete ventricosum]
MAKLFWLEASCSWEAEAYWERRLGCGDGEEGQEARGSVLWCPKLGLLLLLLLLVI